MIQVRLPADLGPLLALASLIGTLKPYDGMRLIAICLTLCRLGGKSPFSFVVRRSRPTFNHVNSGWASHVALRPSSTLSNATSHVTCETTT